MSSVSLNKLAIRGAAWTILGYGISNILRLGGNLILTRLLAPELFGLMALVNVFLTGLALFSDIGISPNIIQSKRGDDPTFLNTAWTLQVMRGFGLWFGCLLIAWPVAKFYGDSRLLWLIPIVGLNTIISGFNSTSLATLNRHMAIGKLTMFNLVMQIISLTVLIVWAWLSPSIWALVGGGLISALLQMVWSHRLVPGIPNRFTWDKEVITEITFFGRWIFLATATGFLASQTDQLIFGKLFSLEMLGVYIVAFTFSQIPQQIINQFGSKIILPLVSKQSNLPRSTLRAKILQKRRFLLISSALLLTVLICFGDLLILVLYDDRYTQAAWMLPILSLGLWHTTVYSIMMPCLLALGKSYYSAQGNLLTLLTTIIGLPLGFFLFGTVGAVVVASFRDLPKYGVMIYGLSREGLGSVKEDCKYTFLFIGFLSLVLILRYILGFGLPVTGIL